MQKISSSQRLYLIRVTKARNQRRLKSKIKKHNRRSSVAIKYKSIKENIHGQIIITAPDILSLSRNYNQTIEFINNIREYGVRQSKRLSINFSRLKEIYPGAALVVAAEIDRWRRAKNFRPYLHREKYWNPTVRRLLDEMGLFDLVDAKNPPEYVNNKSEIYIRFKSNTQAIGTLAKELRLDLEQISGVVTRHKDLYGALIEAMKNTFQHAYPNDYEFDIHIELHRWWMCAAFDAHSKKLSVMFYDQGAGIPHTLPRQFTIERIRDWLAIVRLTENDAAIIKAAIAMGRSRTGEENRGNGLPKIRDYVAGGKNDRLRIVSGRGEYIYCSDGSESLNDQRMSLGGTLIQWEISAEDDGSDQNDPA